MSPTALFLFAARIELHLNFDNTNPSRAQKKPFVLRRLAFATGISKPLLAVAFVRYTAFPHIDRLSGRQ
jgi:hypothetical protein